MSQRRSHRAALSASVALLLNSTASFAQYVPQYGYPIYPPGGYMGSPIGGPGAVGTPGMVPGYPGQIPPGAVMPGQYPGQMVVMPGQAQAVFVAPPAPTAGSQSSAQVVAVDPPGGLGGYNAPGGNAPGSGASSGIRNSLVQRAGRSQGLLDGYNIEVDRLNQATEKIAARFEDYAFEPLLVNGTVVPPVITEIRGSGIKKSDTVLDLAQGTYRIVQPAHVVVKLPNWRDYLIFSAPPRLSRPAEFAPRSKDEQKVWTSAYDAAVQEGISEAREAYSLNMNRLVRDFVGMKLYHELARAGAITLPRVTREQRALQITEAGTRATANGLEVKVVVQPRFNPKAPASAYLNRPSLAPPVALAPVPPRATRSASVAPRVTPSPVPTSVPSTVRTSPVEKAPVKAPLPAVAPSRVISGYATTSASNPTKPIVEPKPAAATPIAVTSVDPWDFARSWPTPAASTASVVAAPSPAAKPAAPPSQPPTAISPRPETAARVSAVVPAVQPAKALPGPPLSASLSGR